MHTGASRHVRLGHHVHVLCQDKTFVELLERVKAGPLLLEEDRKAAKRSWETRVARQRQLLLEEASIMSGLSTCALD